jgi:serine/threonine protein kinase
MLVPGTVLQNRYKLVKELGRGGMGAVYEATDQRLRRTVALKETRVVTDVLKRAFEREARLLAHLNHPLIPRVSDYFTEGEEQFLIMDFIPGDDLNVTLKKQKRPFTVPQILYWMDDLLEVLEYLHTHVPPIIHRDIKPANLKLNVKGRVVLLDFGLARGVAGQKTMMTITKTIPGYSQHYAPLEQIHGESTSPRSDLYALSATLYHLLTGNHPQDALARATALINDERDPLPQIRKVNPKVPVAVSSVIMRGLALRPAERPESAAAMRAQLRKLMSGHQPVAEDEMGEETIVPTADRAR